MRLPGQRPEPGEQDRETKAHCGISALSRGRKKHTVDEKMPPSGKVNSPVMFILFFKAKFVTYSLKGDLSTIDRMLGSRVSSENLEVIVALLIETS